jgi:hypothetical protein
MQHLGGHLHQLINMKNRILPARTIIVFILGFGCAAASNAQSVSGSIANGTVTKGVAARATVALSVPSGLHVNSHRPNSEYQIPTSVRATSAGARIGVISYPRGHNRKFSFSETPLNVYEGRTLFGFNVTVPPGFKGKTISVRVTVKYQACTDEVCYAPKSKDITLTARIR